MVWPECIAVLATVGLITRRLLGLSVLGPRSSPPARERERLSRGITLELRAQTAILAVALNDAMEERDCGHPELARSTLHLAAAQWDQQAETVLLLLHAVTRHLTMARLALPPRALVPEYFKSECMRGYLALHDSADQFVFRSKPRFNLHVRGLVQALARLSDDFAEAQSAAHMEPDPSSWTRLDDDFHDFDLLSKEALLTVRSFIASLPSAALQSFAAEVQPVLRRSVRAEEPWDA
jgi:hypothetical protein